VPAGDGTNYEQFVVSSDTLTVTDTITGLTWQRDGSGTREGCTNLTNDLCTWAQAKAYCANLSLGGFSDWRLPGRNELVTMMDFTNHDRHIDATAFTNTRPERYWTSTEYAESSDSAWSIGFLGGDSAPGEKTARSAVRCVR
jgi:hypothetical protein